MDATQQRIGFDFEDVPAREAIVRRLLRVPRLFDADGRPLPKAKQEGVVDLLLRISKIAGPTAADRTFGLAAQTSFLAATFSKEAGCRQAGASVSERTIQRWAAIAEGLGVLRVDRRSREYGGRDWNVWRVDLAAIERLITGSAAPPVAVEMSGPVGPCRTTSDLVGPGRTLPPIRTNKKQEPPTRTHGAEANGVVSLIRTARLKESARVRDGFSDGTGTLRVGVERVLTDLGITEVGHLLRAGRVRGLDPQEIVEETRSAVSAARHPANAGKFLDPTAAAVYRVRKGRWPARDVLEGAALAAWSSERSQASAATERKRLEERAERTLYEATRYAQRRRREGIPEEDIRREIVARGGEELAGRMVWFEEQGR